MSEFTKEHMHQWINRPTNQPAHHFRNDDDDDDDGTRKEKIKKPTTILYIQ